MHALLIINDLNLAFDVKFNNSFDFVAIAELKKIAFNDENFDSLTIYL